MANVPLKQQAARASRGALNAPLRSDIRENQDIFAGPALRKCECAAVMMPMPEIGAYV
jgi:hypothetical protein